MIGIFQSSPAGRFLSVNPTLAASLGYDSPQELIDDIDDIAAQVYAEPQIRREIARRLREGQGTAKLEVNYLHRNGNKGIGNLYIRTVRDQQGKLLYYEGITQDITDRKQAEETIKASLQENEVLLKELYHRTKNNLQVVSSLLKLQSNRFSDPTVQHAFQDTMNRIWSMSKVHEKLYQSKNLSYIDLKDYIQELVNFLLMNYQTEYGKISLHLDLQSVIVNIDTAMPCGLIINELVSNAIKYAFPGGRKGKISIFLGTTQDDDIELRVADDGVGLPPELDLKNIDSLGLTLAIDLAKRQLKGQVEVRREQGMEFHLLFKKSDFKPKI
jgi:PAS domain S-box-containing protein